MDSVDADEVPINADGCKLPSQVNAHDGGGASGQGSKELFDTKLRLGIAENTIEQLRADAVKKAADFDAVVEKKDSVIDAMTTSRTALIEENAKFFVELKYIRVEKEELVSKSKDLKRKFADVNEEHGTLKKLYDDLKGDNVRLAVHLHDKKTQLEALKAPKETIAELKKEVKSLTEQNEGLTRYINKNDI
jgi:chromosome segregation ATPase